MVDLLASCPAPEPWASQPPERPQGDGGTSCSSTAAPLPIDVAALSVGLPDGVYYAGKKLTAWMSFYERLEMAALHRRAHTLGERGRYVELAKRRAGESMVVRWEIENGIPSAPAVLANPYGDGRDPDNPSGRGLVKAFLWGNGAGHTDVYHLGWVLVANALERWADERVGAKRTNDEIHKLTDTFADEWILPAKQIRQIAARCDLLKMAEEFEDAKQTARDEGLDVDAILAVAEAS